jgi:hypothetical protein
MLCTIAARKQIAAAKVRVEQNGKQHGKASSEDLKTLDIVGGFN